jgi:protein gp37
MAENSAIEWTDHTFNPWVGCTKVSPACVRCYAEAWAKRTGQDNLWAGKRRRTSEANWKQPIIWNRKAKAAGVRAKVFCASLADVFDNQVPDGWRVDLWRLIEQTPDLDWLLLTKRPQNAGRMIVEARRALLGADVEDRHLEWPWPNVWLGTTVDNQAEADRRIPHLLATPARVRFLSCEPLLGPVNLTRIQMPLRWGTYLHDTLTGLHYDHHGRLRHSDYPPESIQWVICGGESGPGARPMHPDWARALRDECKDADVPFFFKQWGEFQPRSHGIGGFAMHWQQDAGRWVDGLGDMNSNTMIRVGKKAAGATLGGREWRQFPA